MESLIFEKSRPERRGYTFPTLDVPSIDPVQVLPPGALRQTAAQLPEVSELDVIRHYTRLSQLNFSIDTQFYPLGSCTMKYNPKVNEQIAAFTGFKAVHPLQPDSTVQGFLQIYYELERMLSEICGMAEFTLQPSAGAHGELTGLLIARAYHRYKGNARKNVVIPDSAHGTNPASAMIAGYQVVNTKSDAKGRVDLAALKAALNEDTAVFMLTNPNTLGLFETQIKEVAKMVHDVGALLYLDGANMNALVGLVRPGDLGFDIMHLNLHKTFSTPHGGGGPAAGPVGVTEALTPFLPVPRVRKTEQGYALEESSPLSIGKMRAFSGNSLILLRAYTYIRCLGREGVRKNTEAAILNANYLRVKLRDRYQLAIDEPCMHEVIFTAAKQQSKGVKTLDIAKRLLDYGFHPPTIYFPLIVPEAMMIEPTETESKETLDQFVDAMRKIADEAQNDPEKLKHAPYTTPVRRLDEVKAAREPNLRWKPTISIPKKSPSPAERGRGRRVRAHDLALIPPFSHLRREKAIQWRTVSTPPSSGAENMRYDADLLSGVESGNLPPTLRFFRFSEPTVSFGRLQKVGDIATLVPAGWAWVQRPTGGGVVYHETDFCLSLCWPKSETALPSRPQEQYRWIHSRVREALNDEMALRLAACCDAKQPEEPFASRQCFQNPVGYDLLRNHHKVVGGALRCTRGATLYQGSVQIPISVQLQAKIRLTFLDHLNALS